MCLHFSFVSDDILEVNFINKYDPTTIILEVIVKQWILDM